MKEFISLRVSVPRGDAVRLYHFRPDITVGEAARAVGIVFGYVVDQTFTFQRSSGIALFPKERLEGSGAALPVRLLPRPHPDRNAGLRREQGTRRTLHQSGPLRPNSIASTARGGV